MSSYANRARPPRTLTAEEQRRILHMTGKHRADYRDHMLIAMALGTGLREFELVALDCGDVFNAKRKARARVELRKFKGAGSKWPQHALQEVFVPDALRHKVTRFAVWKKKEKQSLEIDAPLFVARGGRRLSCRRVREIFSEARELAELGDRLHFHSLRHTYCQNLYEKTRDIRLVQRAARHANLTTTTIYAEPSTDMLAGAVRDLDC
jgi:site-specific recombinase XerC